MGGLGGSCSRGSGRLSDPPLTIRLVAIELSDELIELERAAWAEQQENRLTVETAAGRRGLSIGCAQRAASRRAATSPTQPTRESCGTPAPALVPSRGTAP